MTSTLEQLADRALSRSPFQRYFHRRAGDRLAVLAYHEIADAERFDAHLRYLRSAYTPVSLQDVLAAIDGRRGLPERAVLITFDDGHRSVYDDGLPLLRSHGVPAVVFVVAGLVGTDEPFWWDEVRALADERALERYGAASPVALAKSLKYVSDDERIRVIGALRDRATAPRPPGAQLTAGELRELESGGIAVGNHTLTHPCLSFCSDEKVSRETHEAHRLLTDMLGHPPGAFAYPNGDEDARVTRCVAAAGYRAAFLFDHRVSERPPPDPLRISRLRISSDASLDRLRLIASGFHPVLLRARHAGRVPGAQTARRRRGAGRASTPAPTSTPSPQ